jgi:hypothetical protein
MINHMATAVRVTKDGRGNVTGWDMYHGQNPKKGSGVTRQWWNWPASTQAMVRNIPPAGIGTNGLSGFPRI